LNCASQSLLINYILKENLSIFIFFLKYQTKQKEKQ
jgi:hypothetical protein